MCLSLPSPAGAGIVGMSATYPMDMVRGRITIQEAGNAQYRGLLHATGCIIRYGASPRSAPSGPAAPVPSAIRAGPAWTAHTVVAAVEFHKWYAARTGRPCRPAGRPSPPSTPAWPLRLRDPPSLLPLSPGPGREEGLLALWRGWLPSVIGVVPYVGLNFGVYETLKDVIIKMYGERCGGGGETWLRAVEVAHPADVVPGMVATSMGGRLRRHLLCLLRRRPAR